MPDFESPSQEGPIVPNGPPSKGPIEWLHNEFEPAIIGPAALKTAKLGTWDSLDPTTRARHLRAFVILSLQAAKVPPAGSETPVLGALSAASYADDEHNAAGAAAARTLLLIAPPGPALVSQRMITTQGLPPFFPPSIETGVPWVGIAIVVAAVAAGAAGYLIARHTSETTDRSDFRDTKTRQLVSTQATVIEVLHAHAERERIAGKPLPFNEEERRLLESLEATQRQIAEERHQPLPSPFDGAKDFAGMMKAITGTLDSLLPIVVIGGALYLISRYGGAGSREPTEERRTASSGPDSSRTITLTRNSEGIYEQQE